MCKEENGRGFFGYLISMAMVYYVISYGSFVCGFIR